ncbi:MAG: hypothetical protein J7L31_02310 [Thermoplasmata archaeon]|nr:hypothetical protein [Thermoplasmata archaeon]
MQIQELENMKKDIEYLKREIERLRTLFEDALLSDEEKEFVEKTLKKIKNGDTKDFVSIDEF